MPSTLWEKTKGTSKKGFDKAWHTLDKLGDPVNRLSYKVGAEAFWPMTLDKESDKAARILRSFCKDGFYSNDEAERKSTDSSISKESGKIDRPKGKQRVLKKIPARVIQRAKGLAIFTTMRTGLWVSGSGGSGVLLARTPDTNEWSPPSGIMLHTAGIGFLAGVDIYDCVVVINTYEALEAFKKVRCTLGGEVSAAAGPVGMGGVLDSEVHKRQAPIWTYMKSRGLYAGVAVDGTIIIERTDENERFYGERISVTDILAGKAKRPPASIQTLLNTVKAAEGNPTVDENLLPPGETPGDVELAPGPGSFGIPDPEDPDPFGVKALEAEGLFIREAGSKSRPSQEAFEFKPGPNSPIFATFRRSIDSSPRNSWRASVQSYASMDRGTQTDDGPTTAPTSISRASSRSYRDVSDRAETSPWDNEEGRWETVIPEHDEYHGRDDVEEDVDLEDDDVEIHEVSSATVSKRESAAHSPVPIEDSIAPVEFKRHSPTFTRARLVTIPKRIPPALPPRNPQRTPAPVSTSTPSSPTANPYAHSRRRSVASSPGHATYGFTGMPLYHKSDSESDLSSAGAPESSNKPSPDREEFHSVSSLHDSDVASEKETEAKEAKEIETEENHEPSSDASTPTYVHESDVSPWAKSDTDLAPTKTITSDDHVKVDSTAQPQAV
ncbi:hypothetical protein CBS63078_5114 [Aspergillus niger]|uniref:Contig An17c0030, genomic contig n=3 Tax=Aspergillus niger TaxID=5061 RepID=A2R9B2_ASPNC|nr:uncharacterized protein An17g00750 [Aspergillus niger]RDH20532.1 DUF500-domain-containing protein [Aspergillus niger ATCC 13496]KAI2825085.1 hypothetical protein CBS115989_44 [Aspergillus niger]KAI2860205.1 hypothetical protein CBS11232_1621 [Aspergillus niger]KAI2878380.1 hypothetical protein CBS115988_3155 [Aspergillus niger]KAI2884385.1 hypothetical protein CBS13152_7975 [Aspergillus niger]|eukprot:XP_001398304.1 hypothetical protein ANI_1_94154 [Aspergillus niger CBS 513.88]